MNPSLQTTELKRLRKALGIPRIRLAHLAGVSAFRLWQAEEGMIELRLEEKGALSQGLAPEFEKLAIAVIDFVEHFYVSPNHPFRTARELGRLEDLRQNADTVINKLKEKLCPAQAI